ATKAAKPGLLCILVPAKPGLESDRASEGWCCAGSAFHRFGAPTSAQRGATPRPRTSARARSRADGVNTDRIIELCCGSRVLRTSGEAVLTIRARHAAVVLLTCLGVTCGRGGPSEVPPPAVGVLRGANVLLVTIDTLRADRVGAYGSRLGITPALD